MVALFIALWVVIFAPLALVPLLLAGDTDGPVASARQPAGSPSGQAREVARLAHAPQPHTHNRAA